MINTILGILFFLVAITIIVVVHEFGHLIVAKRNGVKCFEFSVGTGPKLIKLYTDKDGTIYNLRAIPLGGYVMMAGEEEATDMDFDKEESLLNKHPWQKIKILFAGAFMNFVLGWIVLFSSFLFFGVSTPVDTNVIEVTENTPAAIAGLQSGDAITSIDGVETTNYTEITEQLQGKKEVEIGYTHGGKELITSITKQQVDCETSVIGISPQLEQDKFSFTTSIKSATAGFVAIFGSIGDSLQLLFNGTAGVSDLMGPVGIASASKSVITQGVATMLMTIAFLSINIGVVNILPFPALDGGRIVLALIELVTKRKVPEKIELYLNFLGFILLMGLFVVVTFSDVGRLGTTQYYDMSIDTNTVCARSAEEVDYTFNFAPVGAELPELVKVELTVSDGIISNVADATNEIANDSNTVSFKYSEPNTVEQFSDSEITVTVKPDQTSTKPLDLTVKVYDEKGDTINQAIYRIER
ncbi:RIP metalloprotease RseP [Mollicutes bacterium LVI A0078]|nr:RIP metalloprotease RseP [Mollicutes bacterium LVI A0075]WOO90978.1 RIP metalloprotease RseP [Mollicutes bacterium LVI A0078]